MKNKISIFICVVSVLLITNIFADISVYNGCNQNLSPNEIPISLQCGGPLWCVNGLVYKLLNTDKQQILKNSCDSCTMSGFLPMKQTYTVNNGANVHLNFSGTNCVCSDCPGGS